MRQILFTAGGTGGHIYPAIAVASNFSTESCIFMGSIDREDRRIVPKYGYEFIPITQNKKHPITLIRSIWNGVQEIKKREIAVCFSTGGYTSLPIVIAAWLCGKKIILHEQNAIPGRSNRLLSRLASVVCLTYPESAAYFNTKKLTITGNPVRDAGLEQIETHYIQELDFQDTPILIFGGSLGAKGINDFVLNHFDRIQAEVPLIWVTGNRWSEQSVLPRGCEYDSVIKAHILKKNGQVNALVMPYFEDLISLYPLVKLVLCRAGATTLAEVIAHKKKAILIPYPYAKDNHQQANAEAHCAQYPGIIIPESELEIKSFMKALKEIAAQNFTEAPNNNLLTAPAVIAKIIKNLNVEKN